MSITETPPPPVAQARPRRALASGRVIIALMLREMSSRYGRSPGGYLWAFLEPIGSIIVLGFGLSLLMRTPSLGSSFFLFFATGYLPFLVYQQVSLTTSRAIGFSKPLLRYPAVTWMDAFLARLILNTLTGFLICYVLIIGILAVTETRAVIDIGPIMLAMLLSALIGTAVGALNCALLGLFPAWDAIWSIITRPLFFSSGIFFIFEDLSSFIQSILWFNPLFHTSGLMRAGFYPTYNPTYISVPYVVITSLIVLVLGLLLVGRFHRDILNNGR